MTPRTRPMSVKLPAKDKHALGLEPCHMKGCRTCEFHRARIKEAVDAVHRAKPKGKS